MSMVPESIIQTVLDRLTDIENEKNVFILLAVESGSRAWGFPSADSDYDVRFVYCHPTNYYLSIDLERASDVIERPIRDNIDLSGWDIRKALHLFRKSNPPILEWIHCPLIYREHSAFASRLRTMTPQFFSPNASYYHYLHMAQGNFREYLRGDIVWQKKYFYVLRPLLAILWIKKGFGVVPTEFKKMLDAIVPPGGLREAIEELLQRKKSGCELDTGPRIETISCFIETELARLADGKGLPSAPAPSTEELNGLFRETLDEVWDEKATS